MKFVTLLLCSFMLQISASGQRLPRFQVEAKEIKVKNAAQEEKMRRALAIFERVMNDELFQKELSAFKFYSGSDAAPDLDTKEVVKELYEAAEHYNSIPDNTAQIYWIIRKRTRLMSIIQDCDWFCRVKGFGWSAGKEIYTYTCFFDSKKTELSDLVNHIAHEWTHKLGYEDNADDDDRINETVPYAFGNLVEEHALKRHMQP